MSDYYHHFLSSMAGVGGHPNTNQLEGHPQMHQQVMPMGGPPMPNPYQSLGYFTGFPEPIMFNAPKSQRSRRKSAPGLDHIKHRRTRSGCYTCRSRRVKCDETHPVCERCRKGKRECVYPEPPPPKGAGNSSKDASAGASQQTSPSSSHGDDDDDDQDFKLEPIMDEDEEDYEPESATSQTSAPIFPIRRSSTTSSLGFQRAIPGFRHGSETPSAEGNKSSSPSMPCGTTTPVAVRPDWTFLPHELQFYLGYFYDNITHYHYGLLSDTDNFFRTTLVELALRNEALLFALVGFSAYHHSLKNPNGKINEFLQYYNRSVTLLLTCLKNKEMSSSATLFTILQLATIEEYLGDWVNLMGHQKAAFEVLTQLFSAQSVMQTPVGRAAHIWYARFDVFIGIMGSIPTTLPHEWFLAAVSFYESRAITEPDNIYWKIEASEARMRVISMEMALLYATRSNEEVSENDYITEHQRLARAIEEWKENWDPALTDASFLVLDFPGDRTPDPGDIVNPFSPGVLFRQPLFASTILRCNYHSITLMHGSQAARKLTDDDQEKMMEHAYAICQICEAVELWPHSPAGSLIRLQSNLAVAALFVRRDARDHMWIRRKFALLEVMGYISPANLRARMAELFSDDSCTRWWLPHDEGFTHLLQNIRAFADERNEMAVSTQRDNLQQIRHVLSRMQIGTPGGTSVTGDGKQKEAAP
ncbi:adhesion and hyphal regulator 1 [Podospora australis]|uniref:Adhesion and hyphal regulator 1 n=1 Tax=Podospora australis TaxID=1536484 RepID=A0AAN6X7V4_9PEZI|nr:adhesion and hyphal regulator 1 [Podospora australis]